MTELSLTLKQLSALSQETRLLTFRALMRAGPEGMQAGAIADKLGLPPNKLSGHLSTLVNSGLVSVKRNGRHWIYRAEIDAVTQLIATLVEDCCQGHPEVCTTLAQLRRVSC